MIVAAWKASERRWIRAIDCIGDRSRGHYQGYFYRPSGRGECDQARQSLEAVCVRSREGNDRTDSASRRDSSPRSGSSSSSGSIELCPCVTLKALPSPVGRLWLRFCGLRARVSAGRKRSVTPRGIVETPTQNDPPPIYMEGPPEGMRKACLVFSRDRLSYSCNATISN